jgi:hypothetical protein
MLGQENISASSEKENTNQKIHTLHPVKSGENAVAKTLFFIVYL